MVQQQETIGSLGGDLSNLVFRSLRVPECRTAYLIFIAFGIGLYFDRRLRQKK